MQILSGALAPADQLPSEARLSQRFGVSRHVVRQSLGQLVSEGRVVAHKGSGYYVTRPRVRRALPTLTSFTTAMARTGAEVTTRVVRQSIVQADLDAHENVAERLCEEGDEGRAVALLRVGILDGEASTILRGWYPRRFTHTLLGEDLTNRSVYGLLREHHGVEPRNAESVLSVGYASNEKAELLGVARGAALLELASWTWDTDGRVVEYSVGSYRSDMFEFAVEHRYPEGRKP